MVRFAQLVGKNSSVTYVANVSDFIASDPGLNMKNVVQVKRNPNISPYPTERKFYDIPCNWMYTYKYMIYN